MKTISIASQKGGTGKSTTASALTAWLYNHGKKVLAIDLDAQANLTLIKDLEGKKPDIQDVLQGKALPEVAIRPTETGDMIPANRYLGSYTPNKTNALQAVLKPIENKYDYCIIDNSPSLDAMTICSLVASDAVLIPCKADRFSLNALQEFTETYKAARKISPKLQNIGIFYTMFNSRATANKLLQEQINDFANSNGIKVYQTVIRRCITVEEAEYMANLFEYAPRSNAASDFDNLFSEILKTL